MNIFYAPFIFYYCQQVLFTLRVSSILSSINDASVDIVDDVKNMLKFLAFKCVLNELLLETEWWEVV